MQRNSFDVIRIPTSGPGDVSGLMAAVDSGGLKPSSILAVLGKTEGNGGVNDFTREYAVAALCNALAPHLALTPRAVESRIAQTETTTKTAQTRAAPNRRFTTASTSARRTASV